MTFENLKGKLGNTFELLSSGTEDLLHINGLKTLSSQVLSKKLPEIHIFCPLQQR